jgi:hypothetical protein
MLAVVGAELAVPQADDQWAEFEVDAVADHAKRLAAVETSPAHAAFLDFLRHAT